MTRTVCPNCGAPWEGLEMTGTVGAMHFTSNCCGCSEEYLAKLEASPTVALSARLAEIEYSARKGNVTKLDDVISIITELRRYMAMAEEVKASVERSIKNLDRLEGV